MVSVKSVRRIGAATLILPALDHLIAPTLTIAFAPAIMNTMFGTGAVPVTIFFILLGIFQLSWIALLLKSNNSSLLALGALQLVLNYYLLCIGSWCNTSVRRSPTTIHSFCCSHQSVGGSLRSCVAVSVENPAHTGITV
jgi:cytochrome bd-type quinol oxidase subunit 1